MRLTKLQANKLRDEGRTIEVFNHTTMGIFNVTEMRRLIAANPQIKPLSSRFCDIRAEGSDMTDKQVVEWLIGQREIDEERIKALTDEELDDPIINVMDENGMSYIVDGIHRLTGRFRRGDASFQFYAIPLSIAPRLPADVMFAGIPWGEKEVRDGKLINVRTGEET